MCVVCVPTHAHTHTHTLSLALSLSHTHTGNKPYYSAGQGKGAAEHTSRGLMHITPLVTFFSMQVDMRAYMFVSACACVLVRLMWCVCVRARACVWRNIIQNTCVCTAGGASRSCCVAGGGRVFIFQFAI
jgi:hypothetical protein